MLRIPLFLLAAMAAFPAPAQPSPDPGGAQASPPVIAEINAAMEEFVATGTISGAVTLVGHEGQVVHLGAVGTADLESQRPMSPGTLFSVASMTKPVVATAVMILQDEGKLDVGDNVSKYIPEFGKLKLENGEAPSREITIHDLLTHTSGVAGNQLFSGSLASAVDQLARQSLAYQPGSRWQYSPGLNVAGRIVEIVAERPLDEFLQERIFDPLEMKNTTFHLNDGQRARTATLYDMQGEPETLVAVENRITSGTTAHAPNPSGGLFSTARDMFRFYQMVLDGGTFRGQRILSEEAVEEMTSPQTGELKTGFTPGNAWGLGWCIVRQPQGVTGMLSAGTFGHGGAFGTQGWVDPQTGAIYVLMIQRTGLPNSDDSEIRKAFQQTAVDALKL